jgi:hypothetical protein
MVDMKSAVKNGSINKLKIADLKSYLKGVKLPQVRGSSTQPLPSSSSAHFSSHLAQRVWNRIFRLAAPRLKNLHGPHSPQAGEKEDLVLRCSLHVRSEGLDVGDGRNPFDLKPAELRKAVAQRGLNPMGEKDELLQLLIDHIEKESGGGGAASGGGGGGGGKSSGDSEGVSIAKQVLELDDDACGILSILGEEITAKSSVGAMKKQYLLISRLIHPDKIPGFGQATKAFQLLVSAYEGLSQPDATNFDTSKPKSKTINRSNEGCHNTKVCCPRCMAPWGEAVDGLEPAAYMHMMTGIKTYHCSTCLLEFGCMTAEHRYQNTTLCLHRSCVYVFVCICA